MNNLHRWLRHALGFSQKETNGFLVLSGAMLLIAAAPFVVPLLFPAPEHNRAADRRQLDSLVAVLETQKPDTAQNRYADNGYGRSKTDFVVDETAALFAFDPNLISAAQWQSLGLPRFLAQRIEKYRSKGGRFRTKSDLKKIYDFPEPLYQRLLPYIQLPENAGYRAKNSTFENARTPYQPREREAKFADKFPAGKFPKKASGNFRLDLNATDTTQLKMVRGIGPGISRRIVKYRDALGGFASLAQVREIYGLDTAVVGELLKFAYLSDNHALRKLPINSATVEQLDAHPYISPKQAKVIAAYRQQHGRFNAAADLAPIRILDKSTLEKLTPYLAFD